VAKQGQATVVKLQHSLSGPLAELNGRYDLRATEVTYAPGGFIGAHLHAGPGIRCVTNGELTYIQTDRTTVYHPGDCFFESGEQSHTAENRGKAIGENAQRRA
jgi:quercetin dioxygenase-like cupin family protein